MADDKPKPTKPAHVTVAGPEDFAKRIREMVDEQAKEHGYKADEGESKEESVTGGKWVRRVYVPKEGS